jgi:hypothetical protein
MAVEMAGEDSVKGAVRERQRERIAFDHLHVLTGEVEHARALVEPDDITMQMACQEAGSARDVERPRRGQ